MDKQQEESREQFEEFVNSNFPYNKDRFSLFRGEYNSQFTRQLWQAWQASRASIVVELPKGITTKDALDLGYMGDYAAGVDDGIEESAKVIRSIGLSIKGE